MQKEAFFNSIPCITLRDETEWTETVDSGWNVIAGADKDKIYESWKALESRNKKENFFPYGDANSGKTITKIILDYIKKGKLG